MRYTPYFHLGQYVPTPWRAGRQWTLVTPDLFTQVRRARKVQIGEARKGELIAYSALADEIAGRTVDAFDGGWGYRQMGRMLDILSFDCAAHGEPPLAILAVRADTGRPGDAFVVDPADTIESLQQECFAWSWR